MQTNPLSAERVFTRISNLQHGSASRPQLVANGVAPHTIDRRLACGLWIPVAPAVFRSAARPSDWKMVTAAAALEGHAEAVIAGWSSLGLQGLHVDPELVALPQLLVPHTRTHESPVASVRQVCGWPADDIVELPMESVEGLVSVAPFTATSIARSLVDLGCWALDRAALDLVRKTVDSSVRSGAVSVAALIEAAERAVGFRRSGARRFLNWLLTREVPAHSPSELEVLGRRKFTRWGVDHLVEYEAPHPGYPGTLKRADALCRPTRALFEFDSRKHHGSAEAFEADRERDARTVEAGWSPVRLTWKDFTVDSAITARRVRRLCGLDGGTGSQMVVSGVRAA